MPATVEERVIKVARGIDVWRNSELSRAFQISKDIDALYALEFILDLEVEFAPLCIPDEKIDKFETLGDVIEYIEKFTGNML